MKATKIYFDTEFTGLHKDTTLISIGMITEDGRKFYAEFDDYDKTQVNDWIQENVIDNLLYDNNMKVWKIDIDKNDTFVYGSKNDIKDALIDWLSSYDKVQFVSDVCHYDFVLLIDIFGGAFDLPNKISPCCIDLNTMISMLDRIDHREAFDVSREKLLERFHVSVPGEKHNSLYDAEVIRKIYKEFSSRDWLFHINMRNL